MQGLWLSLIIAPYAVSNVVGVAAWRNLLMTDTGYVNAVLVDSGLPRINWISDPNWAFISIVAVSVWRELPFVLIILYAALLSIPSELKEAARVDGANPVQQLLYVVLPLILPAMLVAFVFRLVFAFRQFDIAWLLTPGRTRPVDRASFGPALSHRFPVRRSGQRLGDRLDHDRGDPDSFLLGHSQNVCGSLATSGSVKLANSRPRKFLPVLWAFLAWLMLLALVAWSIFPIAFVVLGSFKPAKELFASVPALWPTHPTLDNYARLLTEWPDFLRTLFNSGIITLSTVLCCLVIASMAAYALSRTRGSQALGLRGLSFGFIAVRMLPPIVITIPLFPLLHQTPLFDTLISLVIIYTALFVSLGVFVLKPFFDEVPTEIEEAALIDGSSRFGAFVRILLPLARGGLVATAVFIGLDAWNESSSR